MAEWYFQRGCLWAVKQELDKAITDFDAAIRLDPKSALTFCSRGTALCLKGELDRAIIDFDEAIRLDPKLAAVYVSRGYAREKKGDLVQASPTMTGRFSSTRRTRWRTRTVAIAARPGAIR